MAEGARVTGDPLDNHMSLEAPSLPGNVELSRIAVAAFAAQLPFTLPEVEQLKVAVSEAVGNCVVHAYPEGPGPVAVRAAVQGGEIMVEVEDWGCGIADIHMARQPAFTTSDDPDHMGLGFAFMEQFTDSLEVISTLRSGTLIRMRKRPSGAFAPS